MIYTLISTATSSNAATTAITSGIDSTYNEYMVVGTAINVATDEANFTFQFNASGQSGYIETITSNSFQTSHGEDDSTSLAYRTATDNAQNTDFESLSDTIGNGADECLSGELWLFEPSSTVYKKNWMATTQFYLENDKSCQHFDAGYFNFTAALTNVQFKMSSGNFDGTINLFGVDEI